MPKNYDIILGIPEDSSQADVKSAYRRLAKEFHPDHYGNNQNRFQVIHEAYSVLGDPARRASPSIGLFISIPPFLRTSLIECWAASPNVVVPVRVFVKKHHGGNSPDAWAGQPRWQCAPQSAGEDALPKLPEFPLARVSKPQLLALEPLAGQGRDFTAVFTIEE